jgi:hypothetical protein
LLHVAANKISIFDIYRIAKYLSQKNSMKDVQATEGAFSPQKRTSSTSKQKFLDYFCGHVQWGSGSSRPKSMRNHVVLDSDPNPQHWLFGCYTMWLDL